MTGGFGTASSQRANILGVASGQGSITLPQPGVSDLLNRRSKIMKRIFVTVAHELIMAADGFVKKNWTRSRPTGTQKIW
jgi:hypothetical protein